MSRNSPPPQTTSRASRQGFLLLAALIVVVPAAKAVLYDTMDPDAFLHLLAAEQMSRDGIGPLVDHQSYMSSKTPWTPYSWLAEFAMKFVWEAGGYRAAIVSHAVMAAGLLSLVALACAATRKPNVGAVNVLIAAAFATYLSIPYLSFRPATLALVVMALCLWLIVRDRAGGERTRGVWLVVPLTAVLTNIHLYAILIPAWFVALFAGAVWETWRRSLGDDRDEARRRARRYALLTVACVLACLATPMLPGAARSILYYQFGDAMVAGPIVKEYQPFYRGTTGAIAAVLAVIMVAAVAIRRREFRAGEIFWLLGSIVLLMRMGRFTPVFAMAAAPMFAAALPRLAERVLARPVVRVAVAAILVLGVFRVARAFPGSSVSFDRWLERDDPHLPGYPADAARFVEQRIAPRTGRLINEYDWGGYLAWRLGPRFQVLLDGRTNVFPAEFWRQTYMSSDEELGDFLSTLDADAAIVPTDKRFHRVLVARGWTPATAPSARAVVLIPPNERR